MLYVTAVVEDLLQEAVLIKLLNTYRTDLALYGPALGKRGNDYIKSKLKSFSLASEGVPHIILTDLDSVPCAPELIHEWSDSKIHPRCLFRIAKREVEAWLLADQEIFAKFIGVPASSIPDDTEGILDPKRFIIHLAQKSRKKDMKDLIPVGSGRQGPGYNSILQDFVESCWDPDRAQKHNRSLLKMIDRLQRFLL